MSGHDQSSHDYVVVGGGAAGAVVAARLVERTQARVLLLEAGGEADLPAIQQTGIPGMASLWGDPQVTWPYETVPQAGLGGRTVPLPQGRVLGGGSSVNAMLYVRGNRRDYDGWAARGNDGWAYEDVLPCFRRAEDYEDGAGPYHGAGGPMKVARLSSMSEVSRAFLRAAGELGFPGGADWDYNGAVQEGAFAYQSSRTKDDRRSSTSSAYLDPLRGHPRLTVLTGATATRVLLDGGRATGVEYVRDGERRRAAAGQEVIVSCGALASPKLLQLSGLGPAAELRRHGLAVAADLPGVGANLHDHLILGVAYRARAELPAPELLAEAGLFPPDDIALQLLFGPVQFVADEYRVDGPVFTFAPVLAQPRSRGTLALRSADPADPPLVDPAYLAEPEDLATLVHGIELCRELAHTEAMSPLHERESAPGRDGDLAAYVRATATTVWHPVGTCRMGRDPMAVVDPALRVHGVERLRVADASVMPSITTGNTAAASVMIGERAADLLTS
ncbi:GMC family oxidoreductase N-terminal domain-containing protein [Actinomadura sp. ATCC 31491]|uniref:GMC family oxidoreductase N-terminal domain-containing protein n=1 Tax=Actinomadura luzonensis TaxID=2805427 RepID=A0ABT0G7U7_9ACTN|nr:GMC family oxidoreductase N-terminal domain-containing protein [Actinomadura luzonensis]MCK2220670.1 GMC family oxidoreductase N-terminal domain-containing protein [Actinomadura luzonensis]